MSELPAERMSCPDLSAEKSPASKCPLMMDKTKVKPRVTPVERLRRLDDMRDREDKAAYNSSRLQVRLDILDTLVQTAFKDEMFLGRQEMNPWRFRRNKGLSRKWKFVHNVLVAQELIDVIQKVKIKEVEIE